MAYTKGLQPIFPVAEGDARGPFGIGRSAHGSDPNAVYVFEHSRNAVSAAAAELASAPAERLRYEIEVDAEQQHASIRISDAVGGECTQLKMTIPPGGRERDASHLEEDLLSRLKRIVRDLQQRIDERAV